MTSPAAIGVRPQRADARRNHERILKAAKKVFAEQGIEAQMDDVASRAGVGVGTVYRHFPTKDALMGELVAEKFVAFLANTRAALEEDDAWEAFCALLRKNAELMARDAALQDALRRTEVAWDYAAPVREELLRVTAKLIARAQKAGDMRKDFRVEDMPMLMCGVSSTMSGYPVAFDWRRHLEIVLDGLRARPKRGSGR
jgi:AcrR family transcriptional regulator